MSGRPICDITDPSAPSEIGSYAPNINTPLGVSAFREMTILTCNHRLFMFRTVFHGSVGAEERNEGIKFQKASLEPKERSVT